MNVAATLLVAALLAGAAAGAREPDDPDGGRHRVRAMDARTARLLETGVDRSPTLRALVASIEAMPVIVYIGTSRELPSHVRGQTRLIGGGGRYRFIRVAIRQLLSERAFIAILAHELEHVREIAIRPGVSDSAALARLYERIGHEHGLPDGGRWCTKGAQAVGDEVRRQVARGRSAREDRP
jgi:hypothetical protein